MTRYRPCIPLEGSQPRYPSGAQIARQPPSDKAIAHATVILRPSGDLQSVIEQTGLYSRIGDFRNIDYYGKYAKDLGARASDLKAVENYADRHGLTLTEKRPAECLVKLRGTLRAFSNAFGVHFVEIERCWAGMVTSRYRSHLGPVLLPPSLRNIVQGVIGLDRPRPFVAHGRVVEPLVPDAPPVDAEAVARHYGLPAGLDGEGQTIGVASLGGGIPWDDLKEYFALRKRRLGRELKRPTIISAPVKGTRDRAASPRDVRMIAEMLHTNPEQTDTVDLWHARWTLETGIMLQLLSAFAPGSRLVVYCSTGTYHGQYSGLSKAIYDPVHNPSVICCSWGADEMAVPPAICRLFDRLFQVAMLKGITLCCSSGDDGGHNGGNFPASSPHVLACGGSFFASGALTGSETPWFNSGGGFSEVFDLPAWQKRDVVTYRKDAHTRGVPDVAARSNMDGGYEVIAGKAVTSMGGTSVAVPLWAGMVARINQKRGRVGFFTPMLYRNRAMRASISELPGETAVYDAYRPGWNPCAGLGRPDGRRLVAALS